jgi:ADP-heptose:LPS heptosyltransferase
MPIAVVTESGGLGDGLMKLPFLRALAHAFPNRPIWWLNDEVDAFARELEPWTNHLVARVVEHVGLEDPSAKLIPRLQSFPKFDLVFDTRTRIKSVLLTWRYLKHREFYACLVGYFICSRRPPYWVRPARQSERLLALVEAASGRPPQWTRDLAVSPAATVLAAERMPSGPTYVGLAIGSGRPNWKNWPFERFIAVAEWLTGQGCVPVFLIGPQERQYVDEIRRRVPAAHMPQPADSPGVGEIEFAIAIAQRLTAAVANDSGIGHLLGTAGTPLVSLFGPTNAARFKPLAVRGITLRARDFGGTKMDAIPLEPVKRAIERLVGHAPVAELGEPSLEAPNQMRPTAPTALRRSLRNLWRAGKDDVPV